MTHSKDMARARRRHHIARIKAARKQHWGRRRRNDPPLTPRQLGILSSTPAPCSCWMCGNPRRKLGERKVQERRLFQDLLQME